MQFLEELKTRGVVRTAVIYVGAAFAVLQGVELLVDALRLPEITLTIAAVATMVGLPVALVVSWAFDIRPDSPETQMRSQSWLTGRTIIAGAALLAAGVLLGIAPQYFAEPEPVATDKPIRRYEILLPDDAPIEFIGSSPLRAPVRAFAISPDGEKLIYTGPSEVGVTKLYVRRLDDFEVQPLEGTEGAYRPFVSPNGRLVAFFAFDELRVVPLNGGPVQTIVAAPNPRGGAWMGDDRILYRDREGMRTWTVGIGGADRDPSPVNNPVDGGGNDIDLISTMYPTPNGRGVLTTAFPGNERSPALVVWQPDSGELHEIIQMPVFAQAADGGLVYVMGNDLLAVDYDVESMSVSGEPRRVGTELRRDISLPQYVLSDSTLIYATGAPYRQVQVAHITTDWQVESTNIPPGRHINLSVSPDGKRLAATILDGNQNQDIWVFSTADGQGRKITRGGDNHHPMWSDDGDTIYFYHSGTDEPNGVYFTSSNSATFERELVLESRFHPDDVHPGDLAMLRLEDDGQMDYSMVNLRTGDKTIVADQKGVHEDLGNLSPDGRWIALTSDASGRYEVIVKPLDGSTPAVQVSLEGGEEPRWSADMSELYYRYGTKMFSARVYSEQDALMVSAPQEVLDDPRWINVGGYSYWPDPLNGGFVILRESQPSTTHSLRVVEGWQNIRPDPIQSSAIR